MTVAARAPGAPVLTVAIPAYNEEQNVERIWSAVRAALAGVPSFEILFIDDGSVDATAERVRAVCDRDPAVRLIRFSRNFGHQAALLAGLEAARGSAVLTLDCDLQHPPELIPHMLEAWREGAKVVQMVRVGTQGASWAKRVTSKLFYRLLNLLSERPVQSGAADYQLLDRAVVDALLQFRERSPFLRGLVAWLGFPIVRMEYVAPRRTAGASGYTVRKMLHLSVQAITGLSSKPLRWAFYVGLVTAALSLAYSAFALFALMTGRVVQGWTSVVVAVTFLGAVQLVSLGILGEYIARIYEQTRGVPRYIVVEGGAEVSRTEAPISGRDPIN